MQGKLHATVVAVLLTVAVSGVEKAVDVLGLERNQPQTVGDEFVSEDGRVGFDFDQVDGDHRDLSLDNATQRVGEGEVAVGEVEVDVDVVGLSECQAVSLQATN